MAAGLSGVLAGCRGLGQVVDDAGDQKGYISGRRDITVLPSAQRGQAVSLVGDTSDGGTADVAKWRGSVVVLNVWWSACPPCRSEARTLAKVAGDTPGAQFLGINLRDGRAAANTFEREFTVPYPSILDASSGQALLALRGTIPPQSVPATVVLDAKGRPAARVLGPVDESTLRGLIDDVSTGRADGGRAPGGSGG